MDHLGSVDQQLQQLGVVGNALDRAGVAAWLRGGWALDFLVGRIMRRHGDIDLVVLDSDRDHLRGALERLGWKRTWHSPTQDDYALQSQELSAVFVVHTAEGLQTVGIPTWQWLPNALPETYQVLHGVHFRTLALKQLVAEARSYREAKGGNLRPKDRLRERVLKLLTTTTGNPSGVSHDLRDRTT